MGEVTELAVTESPRRECEAVDRRVGASILARVERRRRRARRRVLGAAVAACVCVAAVIAGVAANQGARAPDAFARWSANPIAPTGARRTAIARSCAMGAPRVVDVRGPFTAAVYALPRGRVGTCVNGPAGLLKSTAGGVAVSAIPRSMAIELVVTASGYTVLNGRTRPGVTSVVIHRRSGADIVASVRHGWYLVWWPRRAAPVTDAAVTERGARQTFKLPALVTGAAGSCQMPCAVIGNYVPTARR